MKGYKQITLANFNCVFETSLKDENGEKEEFEHPMLEYFEKIVLPAFENSHKYGNDFYFFHDIEVKNSEEFGFYLSGKIVKSTTLDVETEIVETASGRELIEVDKKLPSAPYSVFIILLQNHRLLFIPNQKGSPTLSFFKKLTEKNIRNKVFEFNKSLENKKDKVRIKNFKILEMPKKINLLKELKNFKKITEFSISLAPLNNDIFSDTLNEVDKMRKKLKSDSAKQSYKNPQDLTEVSNAILKTEGLAEFAIVGSKNEGEKEKTYRNDSFSEKLAIVLPDHQSEIENENMIIRNSLNDHRVREISSANSRIYNKFLDFLKSISLN